MSNSANTLWQSGMSRVTSENVHTRLLTVSLADIDLVEVRRPLLAGAVGFAAATTALGWRFADVLLPSELMTLVGAGLAGLIVALIIARLKLHSYSIDGIAITLPTWRANGMRRAIDTAIAARGKRRSIRRHHR